ncbi:MAG: 16S rRNA (cytidine(1402)-2'-O)-methyltransferase [Candidatus Levybacteria bacterium]|nr:16S rRNA (cytidine(1402)-2'-O)-methyltransferase [Candidatus Levybacteria bacterium]
MGTLFVVPTPIGNIKDITFRALEVLGSVDAIACEDTRKAGNLLKRLRETFPSFQKERTHLISYYEQNEFRKIPEIVTSLINGLNIALVTDAGMPGISDPGYRLITACIEQGIAVEVLPGPDSATTALIASGLPPDKFLFLGFLPHKPGNRKKLLEQVEKGILKKTVIFFEAPHKIVRTLEELQTVFGDIPIVLCRELTKIYQEIRREKISESLTHFQKTPPKGEFTVLFHHEKP